MTNSRRDFLKKSLKAGALTGVVGTFAMASDNTEPSSSGVVKGKIAKKEVLYHKTKEWEKYYKIAF